MDFDPYDTLGVDRSANKADIRKAYRAKVKGAHPDTGGSEEEFGKLQQSYLVLSNPEKRSHYDKTGKAAPEDKEHYMEIIISLLESILQQDLPLHVDYITVLKGSVDKTREEVKRIQDENKLKKEKLIKARDKFRTKKKGADNAFSAIFNQKIEVLGHKVGNANRMLLDLDKAKLFLEDYVFMRDAAPPMDTGMSPAGNPFTFRFRNVVDDSASS